MKLMLVLLDYFFLIFHTLFTLFNIFGWMFKKTRLAHLITMLLTTFSWFVLGIFYGFGYCFCTDWHWQVRDRLGYIDTSRSYIHFLVLKISGLNINENLVINITFIVYFTCLFFTVVLNTRDLLHFFKNKSKNN